MKADNKVIKLEDNWTEKQVERYFCKKMEDLGCQTYKFVSPGCVGVPDRIVILPGGEVWFVELKRKGGKLSAVQGFMLCELNGVTPNLEILRGKEGVDSFFEFLKTREEMHSGALDAIYRANQRINLCTLGRLGRV